RQAVLRKIRVFRPLEVVLDPIDGALHGRVFDRERDGGRGKSRPTSRRAHGRRRSELRRDGGRGGGRRGRGRLALAAARSNHAEQTQTTGNHDRTYGRQFHRFSTTKKRQLNILH